MFKSYNKKTRYTAVPAFFQRSRSICVSVSFQLSFHLGSRTKSIAPVTFKSMECKSEWEWNDNWNENETQMEWECWKNAGTKVYISQGSLVVFVWKKGIQQWFTFCQIFPDSKNRKKKRNIPTSHNASLFTDYISSGNKSRMGSSDAPIDRSHPGKQHTEFVRIAIGFNGRGWPSEWKRVDKKYALKGGPYGYHMTRFPTS